MKETTLDQVKVGDLLWANSDFPKRQYPKIVTRVTNSMVFSKGYKLSGNSSITNNPEYLTTLGLKGLKVWGDHWDGGAEFPIQGNEHLLTFGLETKEKKTYKHRGQTRNNIAFILDPKDAKITYDFYIR